MNQSELLALLETSREAFLDAIEGLSPDELEEAGVVGEWSVKDILYHLTRWEAELVRLLWQAGMEAKPTTQHFQKSSVDEANATWHKEGRLRALEHVLDDFHAVRSQTLARVETFNDRDLTDPRRYRWLGGRALWEWIEGDSFGHENEHIEQITEWRKRRENKS